MSTRSSKSYGSKRGMMKTFWIEWVTTGLQGVSVSEKHETLGHALPPKALLSKSRSAVSKGTDLRGCIWRLQQRGWAGAPLWWLAKPQLHLIPHRRLPLHLPLQGKSNTEQKLAQAWGSAYFPSAIPALGAEVYTSLRNLLLSPKEPGREGAAPRPRPVCSTAGGGEEGDRQLPFQTILPPASSRRFPRLAGREAVCLSHATPCPSVALGLSHAVTGKGWCYSVLNEEQVKHRNTNAQCSGSSTQKVSCKAITLNEVHQR